MLGGLGHDRGFPCRDKDFLPYIVTKILRCDKVPLCTAKEFSQGWRFCRDRVSKGGVMIESSYHDPLTRPAGTTNPWTRARQAWAHAPAMVLRA